MTTDPFAGIGGSYVQNPDGSRELVERTGAEIATPAAPEPEAVPEPEPDKLKK